MAGVTAAVGADLPVGRDDEGVGWPSELLPALMAETAAMGTAGTAPPLRRPHPRGAQGPVDDTAFHP